MSVLKTIVTAAAIGLFAIAQAQADDAEDALKQIKEAFGGTVPSYFQSYPKSALAGGWALMKNTDFNENMALPAKTRELIGLAVASQIPCQYCVYYHTKAAAAAGATPEEIKEAVLVSSLTRHWSTILYGNQFDMSAFRTETDGFFPAK